MKYIFWKLGACDLETSCVNAFDFYTSSVISNIPTCYQFFTQVPGNCAANATAHGYDIRSLNLYRDSSLDNFRNPYTDQPFTEDDIRRLNTKLKWLKRFDYQTNHPAPVSRLSVHQHTVNVFSAINEHQYADHKWFLDLSFYSLKSLYQELHEIWNYRLPMQSEYKSKITSTSTSTSTVFHEWDNIRDYQRSMENKLRTELLTDIDKLVNSGETIDHCKSGCYIFMLGLVLVSEDAATSHPDMYQAAYHS